MSYDAFLLLLRAHRLPAPETEVVFAPPREWRADYLWRGPKVIVEREGGIWSKAKGAKAAHAMPLAILRDMEKSNAAQVLGYAYLRYTPTQLENGDALGALRSLLRRTEC